MVFILGASSLFYAKQAQPRKLKDQLQRSCLAIKGLSLTYSAKNQKKTVQYILHNKPQLASRNDIVLWHDLINKSISKHISKNFQWLSALQINRLFNNNRGRITATIFCYRESTDNVLPVLQESSPLTISILNHNVSQKMQKTKPFKSNTKLCIKFLASN